jgi:hypothetical protein
MIFVKLSIGKLFENLSRSFKVQWNLTKITGTLREDIQYVTYDKISLYSSCTKKCFWHTMWRNSEHILFSVIFFRKSCRLWDSVAKYGSFRRTTDDNVKWSLCVACWITKATDTHSEYVTLIAFPRQLWLCERALYSRYTYFASLINPCNMKGSGA